MTGSTKGEHKHLPAALNVTILVVIGAFCTAVHASLLDFIFFLIAWNAMIGCVRLAVGVFPKFNNFPYPAILTIAYLIFIIVSTWIALDRLVMGNLPLPGVVFIFAYSGLPEFVVQSRNPHSEIYKHMC